MSFIVVPIAQADRVRKALARLEGLPRRATVVGGPDMLPQTYTAGSPGWTDACTPEPDDDGSTAAIEIPASLEKHLGKTVTIAGKSITLPTLAEVIADESALPSAIKATRDARRNAVMPEAP